MLRFKLFLCLRGMPGRERENTLFCGPPLSEAGALPNPRRIARSAALICVNARLTQYLS